MRNLGFSARFSSVGFLTALAWVVRLACVVVVLVVIAGIVWDFVVEPTGYTSDSTRSSESTTQMRQVDIQKIVSAELFGSAELVEETLNVNDLQETSLNLTLEGTFVATDSQSHSIALIANRDRRGSTREYRRGDAIASFAEIVEIRPRFVVIARSGEREMLKFDEKSIFDESQPSSSAQSLRATPSPHPSIDTGRRLQAERFQSMQIADLKPLGLTEIQTSEGPMLALADPSGTSHLARLGMLPGDVVASVNGHTLDSLRHDPDLAKQVLNADEARLEIRRAGRQFYLTVPMP